MININSKKIKQYVHIKPDHEGFDLPWPYVVVEEFCLNYGEKDLLCVVAEGKPGSICIGACAPRFIFIPGYFVIRDIGFDEKENSISIVLPVLDITERDGIAKILSDKRPGMQACFLDFRGR